MYGLLDSRLCLCTPAKRQEFADAAGLQPTTPASPAGPGTVPASPQRSASPSMRSPGSDASMPLADSVVQGASPGGPSPRGPLQPATTQRTRSSQQSMPTARRSCHQQRATAWRWQQVSQQARRLMHSLRRPRLAVAALLQLERLRTRGCCWTVSTSLSSAASCRTLRCVTRAGSEIACRRLQCGVGTSGHTASLAHNASLMLCWLARPNAC